MADPRLQWRQLEAPDTSAASEALARANNSFNSAFDSANSLIAKYQAGIEGKADAEVMQELALLGNEEEYTKWLQKGGLKGRNVSKGLIDTLNNQRGTLLGYQNDRSIMNDRSGRLSIAQDANQRAGETHQNAMTDWQWDDGRRREIAGLSDEVVNSRLEGQEYGRNGQSNPPLNFVTYSNQNATRNKPINDRLLSSMSFLGDMGIRMDVISGGQDGKGEGTRRTGSTRHDHGNAADVDFYQGDRKLDWNNPQDLPVLEEIVGRARANGVTGIGAGNDYMGAGRFHIGFGTEAVWGADGKGENAPEFLRRAVASADQYRNSDGSFNVTQAAQDSASGRTPARDTLTGALANSQYLSLDDINKIMNGDDTALDQGDTKVATELAAEQEDIVASLLQQAVANPENLSNEDVVKEVREAAIASGKLDDSEVLEAGFRVEEIIANSNVMQQELAPAVADDVRLDATITDTLADETRRFEGQDQTRAIGDIDRYREDPTQNLIADLGITDDPETRDDFDANNLRNMINEYANDFNVEPEVVAVAMRDSFKRDPGEDGPWWTGDVDMTRNILRNRFNKDEVRARVEQLGPDARRDYDRGRSNIRVMETQMRQVQAQQRQVRQRLEKLPEGDPRRRSLEAQLIALDGQLEAINSANTNRR